MDFAQMPIGFSMALAQNEAAMKAYAAMTREQRQAVLNRAHNARSRGDMHRIVADIPDNFSKV